MTQKSVHKKHRIPMCESVNILEMSIQHDGTESLFSPFIPSTGSFLGLGLLSDSAAVIRDLRL